YVILALATALLGVVFIGVFRRMHALFDSLKIPQWLKPGVGGLLLGLLVAPLLVVVGRAIGQPGQGLGLLGGGYGAMQMAITGNAFLPPEWMGVLLLGALALTKILASSLTIASGGSAGDFAPAMAVGGLLGGAFGRGAALLLPELNLQPGAFALVGMSAFYGGIAHAPLSSLVLVCELAGNYDLLVPLMLCQGIVFVALRNRSIYPAQVASPEESPLYRDVVLKSALAHVRVRDVLRTSRATPIVLLEPGWTAQRLIQLAAEAPEQEVFPVVDAGGKLLGIVTSNSLRVLGAEKETARFTLAVDLMERPVTVQPDQELSHALRALIGSGYRELPVVDEAGRVIELLDEADVASVYLRAVQRAESADRATTY
ncbi:MAG TPA: chloride channel protein, partial [Polyangiaceae bacterium]|nr:chloride channel protein [Polyangiaceae bacterium]